MRQDLTLSSIVFVCWLLQALCCAQPVDVDFNRDIRPILSENCFFCHGPDEAQRQAGLRLDCEESVHGIAIEPGDPSSSELFERVISDDDSYRMPPIDSGKSLSTKQIELLQKWIADGAKYQEHWSFAPPRKALGPGSENAIDYFVERQLIGHGYRLSPAATKETLIRRASFDLTGLPPTLQQMDDFLKDDSEQAFEKVVDRLLDSPHFGQRMASDWLDVARYSDTYGYQVDRDRMVWPWRDWVIRVFNNNLPYDEFITQQIAGDLIPDPKQDQILATTFCRLHPQKVEGGSVPEEFRIEYVSDRMQTFGTAFLGLTLECCRCHHHKFDPISQKEYFQLTAFFDNIDEAGLYSFFTDSVPTPTLQLMDASQRDELKRLERLVAAQESELVACAMRAENDFFAWQNQADKEPVVGNIAGQIAHIDFEESVESPNLQVEGKYGQAAKLTGDDPIKLDVGNFKRSDPFSISLWLNIPVQFERAVVLHRSRAWTDAGSRGYQLLIENGRLSFSLVHFMPGNAITVQAAKPLPTRTWHHVAITYDGSSRAAGVKLFTDGSLVETEIIRDQLSRQIQGGGNDHITIGERFRDKGLKQGLVDEFRVFDRQLSSLEITSLYDANYRAKTQRDIAEDLNALIEHYLLSVSEPLANVRNKLRSCRRQLNDFFEGIDEIMVMRELAKPRTTYLLGRGRYDLKEEVVEPAIPAFLPDFPRDEPRDRLGLAKWVTHPNHPLTARVAVNRLWQMLFGEGLVRTPEDFGSQGQAPTHPELLDWLARDFVDHHWDVKRLVKQIAMSRVYQQSSIPIRDDKGLLVDRENRLLGRGPSHQLSAEMLRDAALAISGLLVDKIGGPPVKPYELEHSFKPATPDDGEGLYRRSLYTYWRRTGPAPAMLTLDASKRDVCRMKRERTSSPLASLVLLNGTQFVEAQRALAAKMMAKNDSQVQPTLVDMFRLTVGRKPSNNELSIISELFIKQLEYFGSSTERRDKFLSTGKFKAPAKLNLDQLAAHSVVAGMIFNLDESITKR